MIIDEVTKPELLEQWAPDDFSFFMAERNSVCTRHTDEA